MATITGWRSYQEWQRMDTLDTRHIHLGCLIRSYGEDDCPIVGQFFATIDAPRLCSSDGLWHTVKVRHGSAAWMYTDGWNWSYHDACYDPHIQIRARGKHKFRALNLAKRQAREWLAAQERARVTTLAESRQMVRPGD